MPAPGGGPRRARIRHAYTSRPLLLVLLVLVLLHGATVVAFHTPWRRPTQRQALPAPPLASVQEDERRAVVGARASPPPPPPLPPLPPQPKELHDSILDADVEALAAAAAQAKTNTTAGLVNRTTAWLGDAWGSLVARTKKLPPLPGVPLDQRRKGTIKEDEENERRRRARRRTDEKEEEEGRRRRAGEPVSRREKAAEGVKNTAKALAEGWSSINWSGLASRAKSSSKDTWASVRAKVSKDKAAGGTKKKKKPSKMPKRSPREQLLEQQQQRRATGGGNQKPGSFLPSLLQRIDPSVYTTSMWNQMMTKPGDERGGRLPDRPRFEDLVKLPAGPAEAWDLFVDDTRHFFDSVYKLMAPNSALPKPGPSRPQAGGTRPKAERVKQGPLYAVPLVFGQQKKTTARAAITPSALQQEQRKRKEEEKQRQQEQQEEEQQEAPEAAPPAEEDRWEALRGRVKDMIEESSVNGVAASPEEYYALEEVGEEASWEDDLYTRPARDAEDPEEDEWTHNNLNLPVPLRAPRLVDRLDERPRGLSGSSASSGAGLAVVSGRGGDRGLDARVPSVPPFPSQPPMEDEYFPIPSYSSSSSSSSFDNDNDGEDAEEEEGEEGDDRIIAPWRKQLPEWLQRVSLTRMLVRKPTPERMMEIIRRRQQVRRMPRKMDDTFLRTVSRKLQGNRLRIRDFQLQTDRYRNSLLSAPAYVDAVVALFGSVKDAEEVLLPLTRWLPEASKRRALAEEYRARRRARLGLGLNLGTKGKAEGRGGGKDPQLAWLSKARTAVSGWVAVGARNVAELGKGVAKALSSDNTLIELTFESEEAARQAEVEANDPALVALSGFEQELNRRAGQSTAEDDPMARVKDVLGDKNFFYFQQRLDLYMRGGMTGIDLYRTLKRLCLANEMRLDLVMRQLREESLREDQKWKSKNEKLGGLLRIHENQRGKVEWGQ